MNMFPTLSTSPDAIGWAENFPGEHIDRNHYASGRLLINLLASSSFKFYSYSMMYVSFADMAAILEFYQNNKKDEFYWSYPYTDSVFKVQFFTPPKVTSLSGETPWKIIVRFLRVDLVDYSYLENPDGTYLENPDGTTVLIPI